MRESCQTYNFDFITTTNVKVTLFHYVVMSQIQYEYRTMSLDNGKVEMYLTSSEFNIFISVGTYISRGRFISFSCHDVSI